MKKLLNIFSVFVLVISFLVFAIMVSCEKKDKTQETGDAQSVQQAHYTIAVGGSTSVSPLMELFQAEYQKLNGNVTITISGTGSGDGIKGALEGTYDIGMSSRELSPAEIGSGLDPLIIAIDGIAIIVNSNNPVTELSQDQIRDIYTGKITDWGQLGSAANGKTGGIAVISREPGSGTRSAFQELVEFADGDLVSNAIIFDGTGAIKSAIATNADAIGYISLGSVDSSINALSVDGVPANNDNVKKGTYKIARPFILITKQGIELNSSVKEFLNWTVNEGQEIVKRSWISIK